MHSGFSTFNLAAANVAPAWRSFTLFDLSVVRSASDPSSSPAHLSRPNEIACIATGGGAVYVADAQGAIAQLGQDFEEVRSWQAFLEGRVTHMAWREGVLVALGEEETSRFPVIKIWDVRHPDKKTGLPTLLRKGVIQHGNQPHPVSTLAVSPDLSHLSIGLGDGTVLLLRRLSDSLSSAPSALSDLPKARVIHASPEPVTGLGFRASRTLYIVTTARVLACTIGKGGREPVVMDELGAGLGCACVVSGLGGGEGRGEMVVAREEAIYLYGPDGRGACYAYEGPKSSIATHSSHLIIVSPPFAPSSASVSATVRNYVARQAPPTTAEGGGDISKVTLFDLDNKFVAYSGTFAQGVREVFCEWGRVWILCTDGKLYKLTEKPLPAKLDILFRKALFLLAVNLARSAGVSPAGIADIYRRYGDHLYAKGDYDAAMAQFVRTVGHTEPSFVVRKFLDAQRIHNLVTYLQELHNQGLANSDHTTLLLNCYTKLKDVARLDSFIKTTHSRSPDDLPFDLETAIRVLRQAGYASHAVYLAERYARHEDYLRIQVEDAQDWADAVGYLRRLGPAEAEENLVRYGRTMLDNLPEETTTLLVELCSGTFGASSPPRSAAASASASRPASPSKAAAAGYNPLSYLGGLSRRETSDSFPTPDASAPAAAADAPPALAEPAYDPPSPRIFFAHFLRHPTQFVRFLEAVAAARWGIRVAAPPASASPSDSSSSPPPFTAEPGPEPSADERAVCNTLLELYLTSPSPTSRDKALHLLRQPHTIPYDPTHALVVCSTARFTDGLILLWEHLGLYEDVVRFWIDSANAALKADEPFEPASRKVLEALAKYGPRHPGLYALVLRFLSSDARVLGKHAQDLQDVLREVDERGVMHPLQVVQVLSRKGAAGVGVGLVRDWLKGKVAKEREASDADRQLLESYRAETAKKEKEIAELSDPDNPRVFQNTRCAATGERLELPAIHFACGHSFNVRSLADNETECPICARSHGVIRELRRNQERLADRHDLFLAEVQDGGGFAAVASAFGRGLLGASTGRAEEGG